MKKNSSGGLFCIFFFLRDLYCLHLLAGDYDVPMIAPRTKIGKIPFQAAPFMAPTRWPLQHTLQNTLPFYCIVQSFFEKPNMHSMVHAIRTQHASFCCKQLRHLQQSQIGTKRMQVKHISKQMPNSPNPTSTRKKQTQQHSSSLGPSWSIYATATGSCATYMFDTCFTIWSN